MKRILSLILVFALAFALIVPAVADGGVTVTVNGVVIDFDTPPQIINGRTMVPMRRLFEVMGAKIDWIGEMRLVIATYGTTVISMRIDEDCFTVTDVVSGEVVTKSLDVPAQIVDGRTLIPLRAVSDALGKKVGWDGSTRTAIIED